jgi:hypothetical protein
MDRGLRDRARCHCCLTLKFGATLPLVTRMFLLGLQCINEPNPGMVRQQHPTLYEGFYSRLIAREGACGRAFQNGGWPMKSTAYRFSVRVEVTETEGRK